MTVSIVATRDDTYMESIVKAFGNSSGSSKHSHTPSSSRPSAIASLFVQLRNSRSASTDNLQIKGRKFNFYWPDLFSRNIKIYLHFLSFHKIEMVQGGSLPFRELSNTFSRNLCVAEIYLLMRISRWNFVCVSKAWPSTWSVYITGTLRAICCDIITLRSNRKSHVMTNKFHGLECKFFIN